MFYRVPHVFKIITNYTGQLKRPKMCIITDPTTGPDNNHPQASLGVHFYDANRINKTLAVQGTLLQVHCIAFTSIKRKVRRFNFSSGVVPSTEVWEHKPAWTHPQAEGQDFSDGVSRNERTNSVAQQDKKKTKKHLKKKLMHFPSSRSKEQKLDQVPGNIVLIAIDFSWRKQKQWISSGLVVACQRACVGGNSELSKHEGRQMSDLQGGGRCWSHLPTVNRPCALNKQTQSLACYQRWPFGSPLRRNNHFQSPQLKTMEPRGFGIAEWEQLPAAPQWLVISF